jgi:hypothetical protein
MPGFKWTTFRGMVVAAVPDQGIGDDSGE